ncbi:hypothetical protein AB0J68_01515 [Micromonospora sp. NPDC049580]|uniref:hypothetical protein n=1 Tax=Micromonospora sp. NPDC049580 TaxID=3154832 RepID=UPI0034269866
MNRQRAEVALAWVLLVGSLIGWPLSAKWWARDEPPFVLGLSWLAITLTALDLLKTSRVHRDQDQKEAADA